MLIAASCSGETYRLMLVEKGGYAPVCPAAVWPLRG